LVLVMTATVMVYCSYTVSLSLASYLSKLNADTKGLGPSSYLYSRCRVFAGGKADRAWC